ncbi:MAG: type II toxin-antitoxin system VapC family toxin [Candidatus Omnitrophica bacterium]|nr:type II toxin-antitoxin system VapC family toxin [Candidatus Omnitrophota bacterium]
MDELILLDTHIWIWLVNDDKKIHSPKFLSRVNHAASKGAIRVSIISVWEVAVLEAKGRIVLPYSVLEWVQRALKAPGTMLEPLTPEVAINSTKIGPDFHEDPADRILVATAKSLGAALATCDARILSYSKEHSLPTLTV